MPYGIGGYDLASTADLGFAYDYDGSGDLDHIVFCRPGTITIYILKNNNDGTFTPVYAQGAAGVGIGNYISDSAQDLSFAYDYNSSGKLDHLVFYRPGTGTIYIIEKNAVGKFVAVYAQGNPGAGIGAYDLKSPLDRAFAFDYDSSGKLDHLVFYRPGTGTIYIIRNNHDGTFTPVYAQAGIGTYDLKSPADLGFAYDYDGTGKLDHLVFYRPGNGTIYIIRNNHDGTFTPVYAQGDPGTGIGTYDLKSFKDLGFAYDYDSSGKLDHLVFYRRGNGAIYIIRNNHDGTFTPVYAQGDPGTGIGTYDLKDYADRAFAYDYDSSGKLDHLVFYRPGKGTIYILKNTAGIFAPVYVGVPAPPPRVPPPAGGAWNPPEQYCVAVFDDEGEFLGNWGVFATSPGDLQNKVNQAVAMLGGDWGEPQRGSC